jgi:hypothetical protein
MCLHKTYRRVRVGKRLEKRCFIAITFQLCFGICLQKGSNKPGGLDLEVNAEKKKYMVMSRDQNAGQNAYIQIGNKSFETVE